MVRSIKTKILLSALAVTFLSLGSFAYLTYHSYKKDRLAFAFDQLGTSAQSESALFSSTIEKYDLILESIIPKVAENSSVLTQNDLSFAENQTSLLGIYLGPKNASAKIKLYSKAESDFDSGILDSAPMGISLISPKEGSFLLKRAVKNGGFAYLVFKDEQMLSTSRSQAFHRTYILNRQLYSRSSLSESRGLAEKIQASLVRNPSMYGLFELTDSGFDDYVTYARIPGTKAYFVGLLQRSKLSLVHKVFLEQFFAFLMLMLSLSIVLGVLASRWITAYLDELTHGASEIEKGNFEFKLNLNSRDEFEVLGDAFNSMGAKINVLMNELRSQNQNLEILVEQRTNELRQLSYIQQGILNSLGQGFVLVDKQFRTSPVYSKIAIEMFGAVPEQLPPGELMALDEESVPSIRELFQYTFEAKLGFQEITNFCPQNRSNSQHRKIQLEYAPIKTDSGDLEYVLIVATDKTQELENLEKFNQQREKTQQILKMAEHREHLVLLLVESIRELEILKQSFQGNKESVMRVFRLAHTIKGNFSFYYASEVTQIAARLEDLCQKATGQNDEQISELLRELESSIRSFANENEPVIMFNHHLSTKNVLLSKLNQFEEFLLKESPALHQSFRKTILGVEAQSFFSQMPKLVEELSSSLGKKVRFTLSGGDVSLPPGDWESLFGEFVHFVRNSIDHGIEVPEVRKSLGKSETGNIEICFQSSELFLFIDLTDDGSGIDWAELSKRSGLPAQESDLMNRILEGGLSSKEEITSTSGRGVGVSGLHSKVLAWGGEMTISSQAHAGVHFSLRIPWDEVNESQVSEMHKKVG